MTRILAQITAILLIITLIGEIPTTTATSQASSAIMADAEHLVNIDQVNIDVKVGNNFVPLAEMIEEGLNPEVGGVIPKITNKSSLRVNTTYSNIIGNLKSIVIHNFAIDVYSIITGEKPNLTAIVGIVQYEYDEIESLVLDPNSSKSEVIIVDSLSLPELGTYKFAFRVQYHIHDGDKTTRTVFYSENMTFELIRGYPTPPYIILYIFYSVLIVFIALVIFGLWGSRRYKVI